MGYSALSKLPIVAYHYFDFDGILWIEQTAHRGLSLFWFWWDTLHWANCPSWLIIILILMGYSALSKLPIVAYHYFDFDGILCIEQTAHRGLSLFWFWWDTLHWANCPSWLIIILILMGYSALSKLPIVAYHYFDFDGILWIEQTAHRGLSLFWFWWDTLNWANCPSWLIIILILMGYSELSKLPIEAYHYFDFDGILCIEQTAHRGLSLFWFWWDTLHWANCPSWIIIILILMGYSALSKLSIVDYHYFDFDGILWIEQTAHRGLSLFWFWWDTLHWANCPSWLIIILILMGYSALSKLPIVAYHYFDFDGILCIEQTAHRGLSLFWFWWDTLHWANCPSWLIIILILVEYSELSKLPIVAYHYFDFDGILWIEQTAHRGLSLFWFWWDTLHWANCPSWLIIILILVGYSELSKLPIVAYHYFDFDGILCIEQTAHRGLSLFWFWWDTLHWANCPSRLIIILILMGYSALSKLSIEAYHYFDFDGILCIEQTVHCGLSLFWFWWDTLHWANCPLWIIIILILMGYSALSKLPIVAYHYFDFDGILWIEQTAHRGLLFWFWWDTLHWANCPSWLIIILILMGYSALSKLSIVDYDFDFDLVEYSELSKLPIVAYNYYDFDFDELGVRFFSFFFFFSFFSVCHKRVADNYFDFDFDGILCMQKAAHRRLYFDFDGIGLLCVQQAAHRSLYFDFDGILCIVGCPS